jgi:hypothetical protein
MKKFTALFLVFSLIMLSVNLYAKERRGAKLIVIKKDGKQIEGELITVKPTSLLLLNKEGKDESVDVEEIKVIRVLKKLGVAWGALVGTMGGVGFVALRVLGPFSGWQHVAVWTIAGAIVGALYKGVIKKIKIEGMTDSEIQEALGYLRKKARIRDYK